jgi:TonB family C-terminal domain
VWTPQLTRPDYSPVTFWGSLIDPRHEVPSAESGNGVSPAGHQIDTAVRGEKKGLPFGELSEKASPDVSLSPVPSQKETVTEKMGEGLKRAILFKPELPVYPEWAKEIGNDFELELKFLILPDGTVGPIEKITSSGYPELDEIGIRYIRKWRFIPISGDAPQEKQWGIIKLVFTLQ